jgi:Acetyltransferase (GNAT) domain/PilZ domain
LRGTTFYVTLWRIAVMASSLKIRNEDIISSETETLLAGGVSHIGVPAPVNLLAAPERRFHPRLLVTSCVSVDLGGGHAATVLDIGEGGLALHLSSTPVQRSQTPSLHLELQIAENPIALTGQIAWINEAANTAGMRFVELDDNTRRQIREWICLTSSPVPLAKEAPAQQPGSATQGSSATRNIQEGRLDQDLAPFLDAWRECNRRFPEHTIHSDPDWLQERFKNEKQNVRLYFLRSGSHIAGAVQFFLSRWSLPCKIANFIVARFPLRVLTLQGYMPNWPDDASAYDMLFEQLLAPGCDALQLNHVKTSSFLWSYLHSSPLIRNFFSFHTETRPLPHPFIRISGSFIDYLGKFSKARRNRFREMKQRLRARGPVQLMRIIQPSEVDAFLDQAYPLAKKTRQFLDGWGLATRPIDIVRSDLHFLAQRGWLRSYLLKCDSLPCAFIVGRQYGPVFYPTDAGVDLAWRPYGAGTILLLFVLEDLFRENRPELYDLDDHVSYKEIFANETYLEASVWLVRRSSFYPFLAGSTFKLCNTLTRKAGSLLDVVGLKARARKLIWR